jgi:hypothetical protein
MGWRQLCWKGTTAAMKNSAVVSFVPCPEDVERSDFISSGEGEHQRTFRCSVEVRTALHQAAIHTNMIEDAIDALDEGVPLNIPVTDEQFTTFYCIVSDMNATT